MSSSNTADDNPAEKSVLSLLQWTWVGPVLRSLAESPKRYRELIRTTSHIEPDGTLAVISEARLTATLRALTDGGLVARIESSDGANARYEALDTGREFLLLLDQIDALQERIQTRKR